MAQPPKLAITANLTNDCVKIKQDPVRNSDLKRQHREKREF